MDNPDPAAVCRAFGLGRPLDLVSVGGALSNRVFRLRTDTGTFALKQMTPAWPDSDWRGWLREAYVFESAAYDAGIPMPRPFPSTAGDVLAEVPCGDGAATVRVHEWAEAQPWRGPVTPELAHTVGEQVAVMHGLAMPPRRTDVFPDQDGAGAGGWPGLVDRISDRDLRERCAAAAPEIARAAELFEPATTASKVMSHGDLDPKNLLVTSSGPMICDWDVAAPWVPREELARVCFDLAYWERRQAPDWRLARVLLDGYAARSGCRPTLTPQDVGLHLLISLDWLTLQVERAAGLRPAGSRRAEAVAAVPGLIDQLRDQVRAADSLPDLLGQG